MTTMEYVDDPASVTALMKADGDLTVQKVTWRNKRYTITATGRQWDEEAGRSVLVEASDGTRLELQLSRQDFVWRVKRVWREQLAAA
ncbi:MAG: hypothetical protein U0401_09550 [Anaerolineae bacterium]